MFTKTNLYNRCTVYMCTVYSNQLYTLICTDVQCAVINDFTLRYAFRKKFDLKITAKKK